MCYYDNDISYDILYFMWPITKMLNQVFHEKWFLRYHSNAYANKCILKQFKIFKRPIDKQW